MRRNYRIGFFVGTVLLSALYMFSDRYFQNKEEQADNSAMEVTLSGDERVYEYYLFEEEGRVAVYKDDRNTLYEQTSILVSHLPKEIQKEVQRGMPVRDMEELFNFLENYSS